MSLTWVKLNAQGEEAPSPRDGHSAAVIGTRLVVFGGFVEAPAPPKLDADALDDDSDSAGDAGAVRLTAAGDVWVFDMKSAKWQQLSVSGDCPTPRTGAAAWACDNTFFVFGGFSMDSGWFSELFALDMPAEGETTAVWRRCELTGDRPTPRDKMACAFDPETKTAFIAGGFGPEVADADDEGFGDGQSFRWFDDVFALAGAHCRRLPAAAGSAPRRCALGAAWLAADHDAATSAALALFGGSGSRDPAQRSAELSVGRLAPAGVTWHRFAPAGDAPSPAGRSFVACAALRGALLAFGGKDARGLPLGDTWRADALDGRWARVAQGESAHGESAHGKSAQGESAQGESAQGESASASPAARSFATLTARDSDSALLFGGSDGAGRRFNDLHLLIYKN